jgi:hypothetical protein
MAGLKHLHEQGIGYPQAGITPPGVDSVWIPMYESNQRSNSHNKSP